MKITTKIVSTLHLQRDYIDKNIRENAADRFKQYYDCDCMEDLQEDLQSLHVLAKDAVNGNYAKIFSEGNTMICLSDNEMRFVDNFFQDKGDNEELVIEVYDGEVFIDRIKESQIDF